MQCIVPAAPVDGATGYYYHVGAFTFYVTSGAAYPVSFNPEHAPWIPPASAVPTLPVQSVPLPLQTSALNLSLHSSRIEQPLLSPTDLLGLSSPAHSRHVTHSSHVTAASPVSSAPVTSPLQLTTSSYWTPVSSHFVTSPVGGHQVSSQYEQRLCGSPDSGYSSSRGSSPCGSPVPAAQSTSPAGTQGAAPSSTTTADWAPAAATPTCWTPAQVPATRAVWAPAQDSWDFAGPEAVPSASSTWASTRSHCGWSPTSWLSPIKAPVPARPAIWAPVHSTPVKQDPLVRGVPRQHHATSSTALPSRQPVPATQATCARSARGQIPAGLTTLAWKQSSARPAPQLPPTNSKTSLPVLSLHNSGHPETSLPVVYRATSSRPSIKSPLPVPQLSTTSGRHSTTSLLPVRSPPTSGRPSRRRRKQCPHCPKDFSSRAVMTYHMRAVHDVGPRTLHQLQCPDCHKVFSHPSSLRAHALLHSGERPHVCGECGKGFADRASLRRHRRVHTQERPYRCGRCDADFTQLANCKRHEKNCVTVRLL